MSKKLHEKPEHWSDIVGMPDDWDKQNLTHLINKFKRKKFTFTDDEGKKHVLSGSAWIKFEVGDSKESHQLGGVGEMANPFGEKIKDSGFRIGTAMPSELHRLITEAYPTLFRDKKHFGWFVKNFPEFRVPGKW